MGLVPFGQIGIPTIAARRWATASITRHGARALPLKPPALRCRGFSTRGPQEKSVSSPEIKATRFRHSRLHRSHWLQWCDATTNHHERPRARRCCRLGGVRRCRPNQAHASRRPIVAWTHLHAVNFTKGRVVAPPIHAVGDAHATLEQSVPLQRHDAATLRGPGAPHDAKSVRCRSAGRTVNLFTFRRVRQRSGCQVSTS